MTSTFYIPDTMVNWPWHRAINPHHEEMKSASNKWLKSFKPFNEKSQNAFDKCDLRTSTCLKGFFYSLNAYVPLLFPARLASLAYPYASRGMPESRLDGS